MTPENERDSHSSRELSIVSRAFIKSMTRFATWSQNLFLYYSGHPKAAIAVYNEEMAAWEKEWREKHAEVLEQHVKAQNEIQEELAIKQRVIKDKLNRQRVTKDKSGKQRQIEEKSRAAKSATQGK